MQSISGYALIRQIYESQKTLVYRATRSSDNLPVVIKLAADPYADERSRKFEHEFRLNALLPEEICVKTLDLGEDRGRKFLVLEDFGGMSLDHLIAADSMSLPAALRYALRLARGARP